MMYDWFDFPMDRRARKGGETGVDGKPYRAGEFMPYYVPRPEMPQFNGDINGLKTFAASRGVAVTWCVYRPKGLTCRQKVHPGLVRQMTEAEYNTPILVSADNVVLDGNHRLAAHKGRNARTIAAYQIGLPFEQAVKLLVEFPGTVEGYQ